jgi:hypothetical protein
MLLDYIAPELQLPPFPQIADGLCGEGGAGYARLCFL